MLGRQLREGAMLSPLTVRQDTALQHSLDPAHFPWVLGSSLFLSTPQPWQFMALLPAREGYAVPPCSAAAGQMASAAPCPCAAFV